VLAELTRRVGREYAKHFRRINATLNQTEPTKGKRRSSISLSAIWMKDEHFWVRAIIAINAVVACIHSVQMVRLSLGKYEAGVFAFSF
jgi:hypothetical protein